MCETNERKVQDRNTRYAQDLNVKGNLSKKRQTKTMCNTKAQRARYEPSAECVLEAISKRQAQAQLARQECEGEKLRHKCDARGHEYEV